MTEKRLLRTEALCYLDAGVGSYVRTLREILDGAVDGELWRLGYALNERGAPPWSDAVRSGRERLGE